MSICDNCIHDEVCGLEDNHEDGLIFCDDMMPKTPLPEPYKVEPQESEDNMTEIISKPFDWNDNFSEIAQEDFSMIQKSLSYGTASTIGMALAKLEFLEKQGCKVEPRESEE